MVKRRRVLPWTAFLASLAALAVASSSSTATTHDILTTARKHHRTSSSSTSPSSSKHHSTTSHSQGTPTPTSTHRPSPPQDNCDPLPLNLSPRDLCTHVQSNCPSNGRIDYLELYYCSPLGPDSSGGANLTTGITARRIGAILLIVSWMAFLFSCLGLVASDFFCPNLSTLASRLGLNESTAGVTFLALGNGSPDVFSTFSAMSTGSGALAIGELIGAASFIVSVVAGSMMLIKPFKVRRWPFLRDVGFFTVAVALTMVCLVDGHLTLPESLALVGLYLAYASVVIIGSMWEERQRRRKVFWQQTRSDWAGSAGSGYQDDAPVGDRLQVEEVAQPMDVGRHLGLPPRSPEYHVDDEAEEGDPNADPFEVWASQQAAAGATTSPRSVPGARRPQTSSRESSRRGSPTGSPQLQTPRGGGGLPPSHRLVRSASKLRNRSGHMPRHSLLGAVEFRDVVRSLTLQGQLAPADDVAAEAQARAVAESRDPEVFLPHPSSHHHQRHQRRHSVTDSEGRAAARGEPSRQMPAASSSASIQRPAASSRGYSAPSRHQPSISLDASGIDDPWKEHSAHDGCEDAFDGTAGPSATAVTSQPGLARLVIPDKSKNDVFSNGNGRSHGSGAGGGTKQTKHSPAPSILILDENGQERVALTMGGESEDAVPPPSLSPSAYPRDEEEEEPLYRSLRRFLFPSLHHWRNKSILGKVLSVVNLPPLLAFNLTLPVVDDEAEARAAARVVTIGSASGSGVGLGGEGEGALRLKGSDEAPLFARSPVAVEEDAHEVAEDEVLDLATGQRLRSPNVWSESNAAGDGGRLENKMRDLDISKALRRHPAEETSPLPFGDRRGSMSSVDGDDDGASCSSDGSHSSLESHSVPQGNAKLFLTCSQCLLAPPFCVWAATDFEPRWSALGSVAAGAGLAAAVVGCSMRARRMGGAWLSTSTRSAFGLARCFLGFLVSIAWISTVVDEVVSILQALGFICGLSEAILGVTLFAMGNSLADLVANTVISRAGYPSMAIAACFAGPLLNLLLGIGLSGTWLLGQPADDGSHGAQRYHFEISPTLLSSATGLLVLLVGTLVLVPLHGFYLGRRLGWMLIGSYALIMTINVLVEVFVDQRGGKKKGHYGVR